MTATDIVAPNTLTAMVDHAAAMLYEARSAAEVIEAFELARETYAQAKRIKSMAKAKQARDALIGRMNRVQADALSIKADAETRLADEYDAAQARGEVATQRDGDRHCKAERLKPTAKDLGLSNTAIFNARQTRDAEKKEPGVVRRVLNEAIDEGREPTSTLVRSAVQKVNGRKPKTTERDRELASIKVLTQIGVLKNEWSKATKAARVAFLHDLGITDAETVERVRTRTFKTRRMYYDRTIAPINKLPVLNGSER
jgi:hypothetical protein